MRRSRNSIHTKENELVRLIRNVSIAAAAAAVLIASSVGPAMAQHRQHHIRARMVKCGFQLQLRGSRQGRGDAGKRCTGAHRVEIGERGDGSGYPLGLRDPCDTAALVRRADIYTAKLSPRAGRQAIAADKAGRLMFMQDAGHPMTAALVKEFGVYPPGCWVRLANGETGIVVRRGPTVMTPVVAAMTTANGATLPGPVRRDSSQTAYAVHSVLGLQPPGVKVQPEQLMTLLAG